MIYLGGLEAYTDALKQQPALADLPFERWGEVLRQAMNWGLLTPHEVQGFLRIQPTLPYFLRSRLQAADQAACARPSRPRFGNTMISWAATDRLMLSPRTPQERQTWPGCDPVWSTRTCTAAVMLALAAQGLVLQPLRCC